MLSRQKLPDYKLRRAHEETISFCVENLDASAFPTGTHFLIVSQFSTVTPNGVESQSI